LCSSGGGQWTLGGKANSCLKQKKRMPAASGNRKRFPKGPGIKDLPNGGGKVSLSAVCMGEKKLMWERCSLIKDNERQNSPNFQGKKKGGGRILVVGARKWLMTIQPWDGQLDRGILGGETHGQCKAVRKKKGKEENCGPLFYKGGVGEGFQPTRR